MARITTHNPHLVSARRGRATTTLHLTDREGSPVDMVFTSLPAMLLFADNVTSAVKRMLEGGEGEHWYGPSKPARVRQARQKMESLLAHLGLLDHTPYRPL